MRGGAAIALALVAIAPGARAEGETLRAAADRVGAEWRKAGAAVDRAPARFLYEDETMTVSLADLTSSGGADQACTTIALLGARGISFHTKVAGADDDPLTDDQGSRASSVAGVLEIGACGAGAVPLEHLLVTSDAGRGAIETLVARSARPLPPLRTVLPERTGGVLPPPPDAGPAPAMPLPSKRAELAELRAKRDGATTAPRGAWKASRDGSGDAKVGLEPGCHRLEIFAPDAHARTASSRRHRLDVDAEIRNEDDELLARDRTDNADAHLEVCVGEAMTSTVIFAGAPAGAEIVVTHASWAIPRHLPELWGPEPRARMARAIHTRHADGPPEDAVGLFEGPSGATPVPITIEPGACYLAVVAVTHGHARGLGMRVVLGARDARDERASDDSAGVVAFCARDQARARIEIEARGVSLAWGLALFRVEGRAWGGR